MRVGDLEVRLDDQVVCVFRAGAEVARGAWTGRQVIPPVAVVSGVDWPTIERLLVAEIDAELEARRRAAHDDAGVDLTLVDFMLSLSPRERLDALLAHARSIGRLL